MLPIGAVEQHGPHLSVRVDAAINAGIVARAVGWTRPETPALVLPMMSVGTSDEHLAFPGTLRLSHETLARVWYEIGESVFRAGGRKIILFNSHGGQPQVMEIVCRDLRVKLGTFAVSASWFRMTDTSDLFSTAERRHGIHGGEAETSVMLRLHGDLVDTSRAENFVPESVEMADSYENLTPEDAVGFGWQTKDFHPGGACGDASATDARRGDIAVDRAARRLLALIDEVARFPLQPIDPSTHYSKVKSP